MRVQDFRPASPAAEADIRAYRALWSAAVLAVIEDFRRRARALREKPAALAGLRDEVIWYFRSRSGRELLALAGLEPDACDAERLADIALDTSLDHLSRVRPGPDARRRQAEASA